MDLNIDTLSTEELAALIEDMEQQFEALRADREAAAQLCQSACERLASAQEQLQAAQTQNRALGKNLDEFRNRINALKHSKPEAGLPGIPSAPAAAPPRDSVDPPASADLVELYRSDPLRSASALNHPETLGKAGAAVDPTVLKEILETGPELLNGMRRCLHAFIKNQAETVLLEQLLQSLNQLTEQAAMANLTAIYTMTYALETLIADLMKIPGQINPPTLRTVSQALDFLAILLDANNLSRAKNPGLAHIFAVDDDQDARAIICAAMELLGLRATCAENPTSALAAIGEQRFDLIFIDVGLPEMSGFELCTKIRKLPDYEKTPVVFLTGAVTVQNRVQSSLSGGNDFIAKPFNLLELGVKALIWILKGQLAVA